jgi:hypothetical protein
MFRMSPRACNSPACRAAPPAHRWVHTGRHRTKRGSDRWDSCRIDCCLPPRSTSFRRRLASQPRMHRLPRSRRPRSPARRRRRLRRNREHRLQQGPGRYRSKWCRDPSSVSCEPFSGCWPTKGRCILAGSRPPEPARLRVASFSARATTDASPPRPAERGAARCVAPERKAENETLMKQRSSEQSPNETAGDPMPRCTGDARA